MAGGWHKADEKELLAAIIEIETRMRRDYAELLEVLAAAENRRLAKAKGYAKLSHLLQDELKLSAPEAARRVEQAHALHTIKQPGSGERAALLPLTEQAARTGKISPEHIRVIHKHVSGLPKWVTDPEPAESALLEQALHHQPKAVDAFGKDLRELLDQDGPAPKDDEVLEQRNTVHWQKHDDGRVSGTFDLAPEPGRLFVQEMSALSKPEPLVEGVPDMRTTGERQGDAFADLLNIAANAKDMPTEGGTKPHIAVTVPLEVLEGRLKGHAILDGTGRISAAQARRLACDAKVIPVVMGKKSVPVDVAVPQYSTPTGMRRALVQRDRGCAFPGCCRPARACDSHHIKAWWKGPTVLWNLVLLCPRHHRLIHNSEWEVFLVDGHPWFRPAEFIDPERTPRRNNVHPRLPDE